MSEVCICEPWASNECCPVHNPGYECRICGRNGMTYDQLTEHWLIDHTDEECNAASAAGGEKR
jgi:hypothetical protein